MRFEIGAGGTIVILLGLLGLSAAVFTLGLVSGYEIAKSQPETTKVVTVYPLPATAAATSSPAAFAGIAPTPYHFVPSPSPAVSPAAVAAAGHPSPAAAARANATATPKVTAAIASRPRATPQEEESADEDNGSDEDTGAAETPAPTPAAAPPKAVASTATPEAAHKPYNIQIDAPMGQAAAQQMYQRLNALGYHAHITAVTVNGRTWYRLQIGPYQTVEEARAAQAKLREEYNSRFSQPSPSSAPSH